MDIAPDLPVGTGFEIGRFRLKAGISEAEMRRQHAAMVAQDLSQQAGWQGQWLLSIGDGTYIDLAIAKDRASAERICQSWHNLPGPQHFLTLIDPIDMVFADML